MRKYLAKRILFFIPVVFFVVLLSFILLHYSPGDPVERMMNIQNEETLSDNKSSEKEIESLRKQLGLDLPLFYFSIASLNEFQNSKSEWKKYVPAIRFQKENQFHRWLFGNGDGGIIHGNLGRSWMTSENISSMILPKLFWSLLLTFLSVLFAYLISIPFGIKSALNPEASSVKLTQKLFIILYSLPAFWIAALLMFLLCNPRMINILPSSGVSPAGGFNHDTGIISKIFLTIPYLILPTICYTYSSLAFLSNNVKVSLLNVLSEDYIRTARAKGLTEKSVIYKHALRNALLPMITLFAGVFPMAIGGSVILETVFTLPGMGLLIYQSISARDYPVVTTIFMLTTIVTISSFLISDLLYAIADPRISFSRKK